MSFVLTKADCTFNRLRAAIPVFCIFFLAFTLLICGFTFFMYRQMSVGTLTETEQFLAGYLAENRAAQIQFGMSGQEYHEQLGPLSFIRITRGHDRLLLAGETLPASLFQKLLHLAVDRDEPWLKVGDSDDDFIWSVVKRTLDDGVEILAGKASLDSYRRYLQLLQLALGAIVVGYLAALYVSLLCAKRMVSPLIDLQKELEQLMEKGREQLLPEGLVDSERDQLYRQMNNLLRQNRRLVSEMQASLDNVAHDLRTPMTRLRSIAEFGLREDSDIEKLRESLADCLEESERVLAMLRIMMSVAEAETGTIQLEYEHLNLSQSIKEMISLYEYVAEERRITLSTDLAADISIQADRTRIAQVWANLLDNGIKYGKEGGWITVEARASGAEVSILFRDNGMGISSSEQPRIWERLYRGDRSRSRQGLGLGLNFVKAIVEAHNGTVGVESVLYEGSCFTVVLPLAQEPALLLSMEKSQTSGE